MEFLFVDFLYTFQAHFVDEALDEADLAGLSAREIEAERQRAIY
jgi:hypothetical protein